MKQFGSVLVLLSLLLGWFCGGSGAQVFDPLHPARLEAGRVRMENALWIENPAERKFLSSREVVIAELKGPGAITMIHFAMPEDCIEPGSDYVLGRDLLLRIFWDGETEPSVDVPLVDFFCDPAGLRQTVNTALVNKRRGFNAYFAMPFRRSAKVVLRYEGPEGPGQKLWELMPCYSYVMYRELRRLPRGLGYFHAQWRQRALHLGKEDYVALEAKGRGKFVGWNVTVRRPGINGYPVDMNEKFFIDGEPAASVEFQGLEDSFGFSYGFPPTENLFPLTGYWPFLEGAMAYRFFAGDAISFDRSLRVAIGFGEHEHPVFRQQFSAWGTMLQFSSTCYWYQVEPHAPFPPMLPAAERAPAPSQLFWPEEEPAIPMDELRARGVQLHLRAGRPKEEVVLAAQGYSAAVRQGYSWAGFPLPVYHCRADDEEVQIELTVPPGAAGKLRLFIIDPDTFMGGRRERILVDEEDLGEFSGFQEGRWVETGVTPEATADGRVLLRFVNQQPPSNAVISIVEWVE